MSKTISKTIDEDDVEEEELYESSVFASDMSLDMTEARSCVIQFTNVDSLVNHIIENIPPNKRDDDFTLIPIQIDNKPKLKNKVNPDDKTAGYWNNFADINENQWILRGTHNMLDKMYPICNRGHQHSAIGLAALAFAHLFDKEHFKSTTVNDILKYGDRIHTLIVKPNLENLESIGDPTLTDSDKCALINKQRVEPADINQKMKMFLIGPWKVTIEVAPRVIEGDIHAKDNEEILNLQRGLEKFFSDNNRFGILHAKQLAVAIFKGNCFGSCYCIGFGVHISLLRCRDPHEKHDEKPSIILICPKLNGRICVRCFSPASLLITSIYICTFVNFESIGVSSFYCRRDLKISRRHKHTHKQIFPTHFSKKSKILY